MNGGPYRAPQPAERRVINRAGGTTPSSSSSAQSTAYRQPDEPFMAADEPVARNTGRPQEPSRTPAEKKSKKGILWTVILLVALAGAVAGWFIWSNAKSGVTGIDSSRYQAVFLSNGQIYFGKMTAFNDESFKISKVYYPEAQATDEESPQKKHHFTKQH